ncbi:MAG: hypothetical protein Q4C21_06145 [Oscillospiraceae bacterium]|nr:hypothetical protein [Oscillospiraceae bacterium]
MRELYDGEYLDKLWQKELDELNDEVPESILKKSALSKDEVEIIEYLRAHPKKLKEMLKFFEDGNYL